MFDLISLPHFRNHLRDVVVHLAWEQLFDFLEFFAVKFKVLLILQLFLFLFAELFSLLKHVICYSDGSHLPLSSRGLGWRYYHDHRFGLSECTISPEPAGPYIKWVCYDLPPLFWSLI
jgi:hypothetical protein